jgi:molybdopterin/thiamine biosynthesis adenylyltransferase
MLRFQQLQAAQLQQAAASKDVETCASGLVFAAGAAGCGEQVFTVRGLREVPEEAYLERTSYAATLKPAFMTELSNAARKAGAGVLLAHTHVGERPLDGFSGVDDRGEAPLAEYFGRKLPDRKSFAAVFTGNTIRARELGGAATAIAVVGGELLVDRIGKVAPSNRHHRQVLAFGDAGQSAVASLRVAIVGLGGTGSVVAAQLAHLGVRDMLLVDPDQVEETNLNRLVGSTPGDLKRAKVEVAARHVQAISPETKIEAVKGDVVDDKVAKKLLMVDFIFACTDSQASRAVVNQLAYQYLIPCIDMGVGIHVKDDRIRFIAGRVQMLSAGLPCLICTEKLDFEQVRREMLTEEQRKADQYIQGAEVKQPAVISLNSTMSSAAVTMFLAGVAGVPSVARMLSYDGKLGTMRAVAMAPRPGCIACSEEGGLGIGDSWALPTRKGG